MRPSLSKAPLQRRETLWYFALLVALVGLMLLVWHPEYEENDDVIFRWLLRGTLLDVRSADIRPFLPLISHLLSTLYAVAPNLPYYDLLLAGMSLTAVFLFMELLRPTLLALRPRGLAVGLMVIFFIVGFAESLLIVSFTRVAILLGAAITLHLLRKPRSAGQLVLFSGLFFLTLCVRHTGALLGLVLASLSALALAIPPTNPLSELGALLKRYGRQLLPLAATIVVFFTALRLDHVPPARQEYLKKHHLIEQLLDFRTIVPRPVTPVDSASVAMFTTWVFGDHERMSAARLEPLFAQDWSHFFHTGLPAKTRQMSLRCSPFVLVGLLLLLLMAAVARPTRPAGLPALLLYSALLTILVTISVLMKMPLRVFSPLFGLTLLVLLWLPLVRPPAALSPADMAAAAPAVNRFWLVGVVGIGLGLASFQLLRIWLIYRPLRHEHRQGVAVWQQVRQQYPNRLVLFDTSLLPYFERSTPMYDEVGTDASVRLLPLAGWPTAQPVYKSLLAAAAGGDSTWATALSQLAHRRDVVWLITPATTQRLTKYLRLNYQSELGLVTTDRDRAVAAQLNTLIQQPVEALTAPAAVAE